jgi:DNA (cytosine-5)-methyltransferase 1
LAIRVLELFCGIGGFAEAAGLRAEIVAAIDQSPAALATYQLNHPQTPAFSLNLENATIGQLQAFPAEMWWLSPPCQPYSIQGKQRDIEDPRASSFLKLVELLPAFKPDYLGLENVAGFTESRARQLLLLERELCPTELGVPCRRPRHYLVATTKELATPAPVSREPRRLSDFLDPGPSPELQLDDALVERFGKGLRQLDAESPDAYTTCFTASYGKVLMHSGSYLRCREGLRRFSPDEILRLLGFPAGFRWPQSMSLGKRFQLCGNSLSVFVLREVLRAIPALH